jgi:hypothetical protein
MARNEPKPKVLTRRRRRLLRIVLTGSLLLGALTLALGVFLPNGGMGNRHDGKSFHVKGGETKAVLDPMQFRGPGAMTAYVAAQNHRGVLDEVYCYCQCDRPPSFHRSLLSCFTDAHGSS